MEPNKEFIEIDLLQLLRALWHRLWIIIVALLAGGIIALLGTRYLVTPLYQASAMLYVNNSSFSVGSTSFNISASDLTAAQSLVKTYIVILRARSTLTEVIEQAELEYSYEQLLGMISASSVDSTEVFKVTATSEDAAEAEKIANTVIAVLPDKISGIVEGSSVQVVDEAVLPAVQSSPNVMKNTVIGVLMGLLAGMAIAILLDLFDENIHSEEYLTKMYGVPVLATIPDMNFFNSGNPKYNKKYGGKSERYAKYAIPKKGAEETSGKEGL